jgi:hypothetical protein
MATNDPQPIQQVVFQAQDLVARFPPRLRDRNKKVVYRIACPAESTHHGRLVVTRWSATELPEKVPEATTQIEARDDVFAYEPTGAASRSVEWYLNFAHHDLFCAYGGSAFAQDEIQVAEHPALGSLREALLASRELEPATVESGRPTPVLVRGVERRCWIATDVNEAEGRPFGLYGNQFSRARPEAVERATRPIVPPTVTNLVAMEAPAYGSGVYRREEIEYVLQAAFAGFRAARCESAAQLAETGEPTTAAVIIHTGYWGCGAYGGNRVLMALLQIFAARLAEIDRLVFHTVGDPEPLALARSLLDPDHFCATSEGVAAAVTRIHALGLRWGTSDGN